MFTYSSALSWCECGIHKCGGKVDRRTCSFLCCHHLSDGTSSSVYFSTTELVPSCVAITCPTEQVLLSTCPPQNLFLPVLPSTVPQDSTAIYLPHKSEREGRQPGMRQKGRTQERQEKRQTESDLQTFTYEPPTQQHSNTAPN